MISNFSVLVGKVLFLKCWGLETERKLMRGTLYSVLLLYLIQVCGETHRFETLMHHFGNFEEFHIDFMVRNAKNCVNK